MEMSSSVLTFGTATASAMRSDSTGARGSQELPVGARQGCGCLPRSLSRFEIKLLGASVSTTSRVLLTRRLRCARIIS